MPASHHASNGNSVLPALHHALSGSLGTLVSTCTLYPLSLVIARLQVQRQLRREGRLSPTPPPAPSSPRQPRPRPAPAPATTAPDTTARAPTSPPTSPPRERRAVSPQPSRLPPARAAGAEGEQEQRQQQKSLPQDRGPGRDPREPRQEEDRGPVGHRRHSQPRSEYAGIIDAFLQIWRSSGNGGLKAFYTGLAQDAPKSVLDSFLFFLFYEWFRSLRLRSRRRSKRGLGVIEEIAVGMAAGACSRSFTTPIANIVTRKQTATLLDPDPGRAATVGDIVHSIRQEKGIAGFWSGYSASLVLTLNPSLTFFLQEFLKTTFIAEREQYDDLDPRLTFLFAATSKAISSFVTYPFQTAKTRLQAGVPVDSSSSSSPSSSSEDGQEESESEAAADSNSNSNSNCKNVPGEKTVRTVKKLAQQSVFGTVAQIVRSEGIGSLYDGVGAELLKGFFSHGTTMVAKDVAHKLLFKLYLVVLGVLAELRRRRLSLSLPLVGTDTQEKLPRALHYRIDAKKEPRSFWWSGGNSDLKRKDAADNDTDVVATLTDVSQRPFKAK